MGGNDHVEKTHPGTEGRYKHHKERPEPGLNPEPFVVRLCYLACAAAYLEKIHLRTVEANNSFCFFLCSQQLTANVQ